MFRNRLASVQKNVITGFPKRWMSSSSAVDQPSGPKIRKTTQLKKMLHSKDLSFIMEAHNGLSAKIVENTGFKGIWASGLSISASMGVRDSNEASWTQVLDNIEYMSDVTSIPILLDADTGYGNFNNARRLVKKLEQRGIAGMCIEDKIFPKTNSFLNNSAKSQKLAEINEFCGKIEACKDTQQDNDFVVVARLESFISGLGKDDALERGYAYAHAGADAILVHSKISDCSEVEAFLNEWDFNKPIVVVPTKYYTTPTDKFRELGISLIIWANHNMRSCINVMKETSEIIYKDESLMNIEKKIATVNDVFALQDNDELKRAEKKYLNYNRFAAIGQQEEEISQNKEEEQQQQTPVRRVQKQITKKKLNPAEFSDLLNKNGVTNCYGVPDSVLKEWLLCMEDNNREGLLSNTVVANEGLAVAMGVGYHLATNKIPVVYLQNSGFGNTLNPLLSIVRVYKIPMLFVVGWRGEYGINDEPQHDEMGQIQESILDTMHMEYGVLDSKTRDMDGLITHGVNYCKNHNEPYFILVKKDAFSKWESSPASEKNKKIEEIDSASIVSEIHASSGDTSSVTSAAPTLRRYETLQKIVTTLDNNENYFCKFFTTTGYTSRELYDIRANYYNNKHCNDFYMVGGMGHCSSVALSAALNVNNDNTNVVCVDGDGAMLMHMGSMSTIGLMAKQNINKLNNFVHILINNGCHESTGKQKLHHNVDFIQLAQSVGFAKEQTYRINTYDELENILTNVKKNFENKDKSKQNGAVFIEIEAKAGTIENLRRPKHNYIEQKEDFIKQIELEQSNFKLQ